MLVVGGGPAGLRTAIEGALIGANRVVILEKRNTMHRNNILHLWGFSMKDIAALGGKVFYRR